MRAVGQTVKAFNQQFQARMLDSWESEKARIMQEELGVTDDEMFKLATAGSLGKSALGSSTRRVSFSPPESHEA